MLIFLLIGIAAALLARSTLPAIIIQCCSMAPYMQGFLLQACSNVFCKEIDSTKCQLVPGRRAPRASGNTFHDNRRPSSVDRREPRLAEFLVLAVNPGFKE